MSSNSGPSRQMRSPAAASSSSSSAAQNQRSQHHQQQQQQQQRASQRESSSFTAEMRDRQSRGKDPYVKERSHPDDDDDDDDLDDDEEEEDEDDMDLDDDYEDMDDDGRSRLRIGDVPKNEGFEERERRQFALSVLDSPEQLMMYAQSTNDSIPGQRYRFMSTLCGFDEEQQRRQGRVRRR